MKKTLSKVVKKAKPKTIVVEEKGQLKKKKLKKVKTTDGKQVEEAAKPQKKQAKTQEASEPMKKKAKTLKT